ncbi:MAG: hypothetical protein ACM3JB_16065 [Acidobacteriaceae bacterium]
MGFADHPAAIAFDTQAMSEVLVVSATDWKATGRQGEEIKAA